MRIWIDGRAATAKKPTGKEQWTLQMIAALLTQTRATILVNDGKHHSSWANAEVLSLKHGPGWHLRARNEILKAKPDAYIAPTSFIVPAMLGKRINVFPVIHDLIAFQNEPHDKKAQWIEWFTLKRTLQNAAHVFVISESTKRDVLSRFPFVQEHSVTVIGAGPLEEHPTLNVSDDQTILCPGTLCPRKNQLRLIEAFRNLPENVRRGKKLILTGGRGWDDEAIVQAAQSTEGVEWKGYVDEETYKALLSSCAVLAFPSLYEGFGLPVLDALQRGVPVLTSNRSSLPDVAGNAAVFVDPENVDSIRGGLLSLLTDTTLVERLRQNGPAQAAKFSWEKTAEAMWQVIERCCL